MSADTPTRSNVHRLDQRVIKQPTGRSDVRCFGQRSPGPERAARDLGPAATRAPALGICVGPRTDAFLVPSNPGAAGRYGSQRYLRSAFTRFGSAAPRRGSLPQEARGLAGRARRPQDCPLGWLGSLPSNGNPGSSPIQRQHVHPGRSRLPGCGRRRDRQRSAVTGSMPADVAFLSSTLPSRDGRDRQVRRAEEREARKQARIDGGGGVDRRPGKQPGAPGTTLQRRVPDRTVTHPPGLCAGDAPDRWPTRRWSPRRRVRCWISHRLVSTSSIMSW